MKTKTMNQMFVDLHYLDNFLLKILSNDFSTTLRKFNFQMAEAKKKSEYIKLMSYISECTYLMMSGQRHKIEDHASKIENYIKDIKGKEPEKSFLRWISTWSEFVPGPCSNSIPINIIYDKVVERTKSRLRTS